jgi:hypothetical protein
MRAIDSPIEKPLGVTFSTTYPLLYDLWVKTELIGKKSYASMGSYPEVVFYEINEQHNKFFIVILTFSIHYVQNMVPYTYMRENVRGGLTFFTFCVEG